MVQLFKEAGKALKCVPCLLLQPVWVSICRDSDYELIQGVRQSLVRLFLSLDAADTGGDSGRTGGDSGLHRDIW